MLPVRGFACTSRTRIAGLFPAILSRRAFRSRSKPRADISVSKGGSESLPRPCLHIRAADRVSAIPSSRSVCKRDRVHTHPRTARTHTRTCTRHQGQRHSHVQLSCRGASWKNSPQFSRAAVSCFFSSLMTLRPRCARARASGSVNSLL